MAQSDIIRRYIDAGLAFTETTRARAEELVGELVRAGEVQREQTQQWVEEFIDRSRRNYETLVDVVRKEVSEQLRSLPNAPAPDLIGLEQRVNDIAIRLTQLAGQIAGRGGRSSAPAAKKATTATTATKAPAKKAPTKRTASKSHAARSAKTTASKATTAKATTAKATTAKATTAKATKATAKKSTTAGTKKAAKTTKSAGPAKASKAGTTGARKAAQRSRPASS